MFTAYFGIRTRLSYGVGIFLLSILLGRPIFGDQATEVVSADASQDSQVLRVITYNVQFFPEPVTQWNKRPDAEYRSRKIGKEMGRYDIIGLQETFHSQHRRKIIETTGAKWNDKPGVVVSPRPDSFFANGGCLLLTHLPVRETNSVVFTHFSRPKDHGMNADGYAAKGVIHARVSRTKDDRDSTIDVYVTHLEAREAKMRHAQYQELADFIKKTSDPDRPILLIGDLNTRGMKEHRSDPNSPYHEWHSRFSTDVEFIYQQIVLFVKIRPALRLLLS